jgi:hypothetical protein
VETGNEGTSGTSSVASPNEVHVEELLKREQDPAVARALRTIHLLSVGPVKMTHHVALTKKQVRSVHLLNHKTVRPSTEPPTNPEKL